MAAPRKKITPVKCPAQTALRAWAIEERRWQAMRAKSSVKWPDKEPSYAKHRSCLSAIVRQALRTLARTPTGAAFQALLLYDLSPLYHSETLEKSLTTDQRAAFQEHADQVAAMSLSLYRMLAPTMPDPDLALYLAKHTGPDTLAQLLESMGFDLAEAA